MLSKCKLLLIVDDDESIRRSIAFMLKEKFDHILEAHDGEIGIKLYSEYRPQIMIVDIGMPKINGLDLIGLIRRTDEVTRIIVVSSCDSKSVLQQAIPLGLDAYLIKPVSVFGLKIAVDKSIQKIMPRLSELNSILEHTFHGRIEEPELLFTKKERELLNIFFKNRNIFVSANFIERELWADKVPSESSVRTLVGKLRKKLGKDSIACVSGMGYQLKFKQKDRPSVMDKLFFDSLNKDLARDRKSVV